MTTVFTVGHSNQTQEAFIDLLRLNSISAIADVRSMPFSRHTPQFNRDALQDTLKQAGIAYVFLGNQLGARPAAASCYKEGKVDFQAVSETEFFREGLARVRAGAANFNLALMCAEKDPAQCHRTILVCRNLRAPDVTIKHILEDGGLEDNRDTETRLLRLFRITPSFFQTPEEDIETAYARQAERIAFRGDENADSSAHAAIQ